MIMDNPQSKPARPRGHSSSSSPTAMEMAVFPPPRPHPPAPDHGAVAAGPSGASLATAVCRHQPAADAGLAVARPPARPPLLPP